MIYQLKNSINNIMPTAEFKMLAEDLEVFERLFGRDISLNTKKALSSDMRHFIAWYQQFNNEAFSFQRLTFRDLTDYKSYCQGSLKHSVRTINRRITHLRVLCGKAVKMGKLQENLADSLKLLSLQPLAPKSLSQSQLRRLLKEVDLRGNVRDKLIIEMMAGAGFRVSELVGLNIEDVLISARNGVAVVRGAKGNKTREVPLNQRIRTLLTRYINKYAPQKKLFVGQRGSLTTIAFNKIIEKYAKIAQVKCSPHTLRHSFAYNYLQRNQGDIVGLAQILGHSNINTTAIYTQNKLEDLQDRVEGVVY